MSEHFLDLAVTVLTLAAGAFILAVGAATLALVIVYIADVSQTKQAIRRNYPVIGRLRYQFEELGKFFRQYFYASDREEMPFNRAQRAWVYRAAKNIDNTVPFGSTRHMESPGTIFFVNDTFPKLDDDTSPARPLVIGPAARVPYTTASFFNVSAMSFGAISGPAVTALSNGARLAGCWLNTGEGGLSPQHLEGGADLVFQIGTAKYGVRNESGELDEAKLKGVADHDQVKMFEIKLSQGAKPGKGGILPAAKVTPEIARIRGIEPGVASVSPNRHVETESVAELLDFVEDVRRITGKPTGFKLVVGDVDWFDSLFSAINNRGPTSAPDFITIDSCDGGSGAAPMSLMDYVGMPVRQSLPAVADKLVAYGLKDRIRLIASGKLIMPGEVTWALAMGADFVASARGFMFALGCIQAMRCHENTCPTGVTTHDPRLQRGLDPVDKAERVANYARNMTEAVEMIAHSCGVDEPRQLRREHCRIVEGGRIVSLAELHPSGRQVARLL